MQSFETYLKRHLQSHPGLLPQDAIKFCYQAAFGAEHLLTDKEKAKEYLLREYDMTEARGIALSEDISEEYARVNIAAWKQRGLNPEWLLEMFFKTAAAPAKDSGDFMKMLEAAGRLADSGAACFDRAVWEKSVRSYLEDGVHPVHHSEAYRGLYAPSYRLVSREYTQLLPLLEKINACIRAASARGEAAVIAIDGRAAAGKSTLAKRLCEISGAGLICMDDFFLPTELRTAERLIEPGSNVHYERFLQEVLPHLRSMSGFEYRKFDCSGMDYNGVRTVSGGGLRIVEGSYSLHPVFGEYADMAIFCDVPQDEQLFRIEKRNGAEQKQMFIQRWIPMEEKYFEAFHIREKCLNYRAQ